MNKKELESLTNELKEFDSKITQEQILKIIKSKPNIQIDNDFKINLKNQLKIESLKIEKNKLSIINYINILFGSLGFLSLSIIVGLGLFNSEPINKSLKNSKENIDNNILEAKENNNFSIQATRNIAKFDDSIESDGLMQNFGLMQESIETIKIEKYVFMGQLDIDLSENYNGYISNNYEYYYTKHNFEIERNIENIKRIINIENENRISNIDDYKQIEIELINPKIKFKNITVRDNNSIYSIFGPVIVFDTINKSNQEIHFNNNYIVPLYKGMYKYDDNSKIIGKK